MQIWQYSYMDTQSLWYFLMVSLQNIDLKLVSHYVEISIASCNCNGLADNKKRRSVFTWLKEKEFIYCLQETHSAMLDEAVWKKDWGVKYILPMGKEI